jgi:VanZ like family.
MKKRSPLKTFSMMVFLVILILVFVFSLLPPSLIALPQGRIINDKTLHVAAFFGLSLGFAFWIQFERKHRFLVCLPAFLVTCVLGLLIEHLQPGFGRVADIGDVLANILGSLLGIALAYGAFTRLVVQKK